MNKPTQGAATDVAPTLQAIHIRRERITNLACALVLLHSAAHQDRQPIAPATEGGAV